MNLKVIAYARNGHSDKFGIPRQSRDESPIETRIVFEPEYSVAEALRGIDGYSHLWLLWGFSETERTKLKTERMKLKTERTKLKTERDEWSPTVRPPRLGGNKRVGVFATRSPFRPNPIGLSSVRLLKVERGEFGDERSLKAESGKLLRLSLLVSGADLLDGTPIYDIKPYLPYSDCHADATNGLADATKDYRLEVDWGQSVSRQTYDEHTTNIRSLIQQLTYILSQDPRPGYQRDPQREYKMDYAGWRVTFSVAENKILVKKLEKI